MRFYVSCLFVILFTIATITCLGISSANAQASSSPIHVFWGVYYARDLLEESAGIGVDLDISYNFNRYAITGDYRGAVGISDSIWAFRSGSLGARYFLLTEGFSPYVGAGISVMQMGQTILLVSQDNIGPGIFGSIGIETGRKSKNRFKLQIRIDRPFFTHREVVETEGITYTGEGNVWEGNFAPLTIEFGYTRTFP